MQVIQLAGPQAGETVDLPYAVAVRCVAAGTAKWPEDSKPAPRTPGPQESKASRAGRRPAAVPAKITA